MTMYLHQKSVYRLVTRYCAIVCAKNNAHEKKVKKVQSTNVETYKSQNKVRTFEIAFSRVSIFDVIFIIYSCNVRAYIFVIHIFTSFEILREIWREIILYLLILRTFFLLNIHCVCEVITYPIYLILNLLSITQFG